MASTSATRSGLIATPCPASAPPRARAVAITFRKSMSRPSCRTGQGRGGAGEFVHAREVRGAESARRGEEPVRAVDPRARLRRAGESQLGEVLVPSVREDAEVAARDAATLTDPVHRPSRGRAGPAASGHRWPPRVLSADPLSPRRLPTALQGSAADVSRDPRRVPHAATTANHPRRSLARGVTKGASR